MTPRLSANAITCGMGPFFQFMILRNRITNEEIGSSRRIYSRFQLFFQEGEAAHQGWLPDEGDIQE